MKKVLITGIHGFIGNAIKKEFETKYDVYGIDVVGSADKNHYIFDMRSTELKNLLQQIAPDIIIHAAGGANVANSIKNPKLDFENSVEVFYNLLESIRIARIHCKVIFLSSAAVYGNVNSLPVTETIELNPISPYGLHKKICEEIGQYYKSIYGIDICMLRIFSVYGPGLKKQIMWDMFQKSVLNGKIELFGNGEESRDFIYIDDLVKCIELVMNVKSDYTVFNIGNGKGVRIGEVAEIFSRIMFGENRVSFNNQIREGDPRFWQADISRIAEMNYSPQINLADGIENYIRWAKKNQS